MNDLFPVQESLSPKLIWMKEHGISTKYYPEAVGMEEDEFGNEIDPWEAFKPRAGCDSWESCSYAETEEEALWKLSQNLGIKFYK